MTVLTESDRSLARKLLSLYEELSGLYEVFKIAHPAPCENYKTNEIHISFGAAQGSLWILKGLVSDLFGDDTHSPRIETIN